MPPLDGSLDTSPAPAHCDGLVNPGSGSPSAVHARGVIGGVHNAQAVVLAQEGLLVLRADLEIVDSLDVGIIRVEAGVGQRAVLRDGRGLQVGWAQVGQWIRAWVIAIAVPAEKCAQVEDRVVADDVRVGGRDVIGVDLGALVGVADVARRLGWRLCRCLGRWSRRSSRSGCRRSSGVWNQDRL